MSEPLPDLAEGARYQGATKFRLVFLPRCKPINGKIIKHAARRVAGSFFCLGGDLRRLTAHVRLGDGQQNINTVWEPAAMTRFSMIVLGLLLVCSGSHAQQGQPKITPIMEAPVTGQPDKVFVLLSIEWPSNSTAPRHTHPGDEYGTVVTGTYAVKQGDGDWKNYKSGESWHVPAGVVHESKNTSFGTRTMNAYILDKDKPQIIPFTKP